MARITQADLESLRMPPDALGNPGLQDIEALKAAAWGSDYDVDARRKAIEEARNRITAALVAQQVPVQLAQQIAEAQTSGGGDTSQGVSGQTSSGATDFSSPGNTGPGGGAQGFSGFGGSAAPGSDFMGGAPPGASMFGTGDRSSLADPTGAMVTSPAAMMTDDALSTANTDRAALPAGAPPGWGFEGAPGDPNAPAAFSGRGGPDREGFGLTEVSDVAEHAPAQAPDLAENAPGGKGNKGETGEQDQLAEGATSTVGDRAALGLPSGSPGLPSMVGAGIPSFATPAVAGLFDMGKNAFGKGWDAVTAPVMTPSDMPPDPGRTPVAGPPPGGRQSFTGPPAGAPPGAPADPGAVGASPGGFGGFSESTPGGYTSGPGSTEGFGAGYSGSASMGNTQGGQGFTAGAPGGGFTSGAGSFSAGFAAGFDTAAAAFGGGGADPGGGSGAGQGSGEGGGSSSSGGDTAGGSPGGVG